MVKISSIVDVPKKADAEDLFGINKYENGLTHFIQYADTPITIAIQGEWGSGKTSQNRRSKPSTTTFQLLVARTPRLCTTR